MGWLFVVLAILYFVSSWVAFSRFLGQIFLSQGLPSDDPNRLRFMLRAVPGWLADCSPLLVGAVVFGRGRAGWRQNIFLAGGAVLLILPWAVVAVLASLTVFLLGGSSVDVAIRLGTTLQISLILSIAWPLLVGLGLSISMSSRLRHVSRPLLAGIVVIAIYVSADKLWQSFRAAPVADLQAEVLSWVQAAVAGVYVFGLAYLVWVCLSARLGREEPKAFWNLLLLGFGALFGIEIVAIARSLLAHFGIFSPTFGDWSVDGVMPFIRLTAMLLIAVSLFRWEPGSPAQTGNLGQAART